MIILRYQNTTAGVLAAGSATALYMQSSSATYSLYNSKGFDPKLYRSGWQGNQYRATTKVASTGKWLGRGFGYAGILISLGDLSTATTVDKQVEAGIDTAVAAFGTWGGHIGMGFSVYWGVCGKYLHYRNMNEVLMTQYQMGIIGWPATMPFK